jgi:4-amino-4-deoxy-L-arabinose transferase-like glycosyltransferase
VNLPSRASAVGLSVAAFVLLFSALDATDLWAPDEPRYAAVAESVRAASGPADRVLLRLNDEAYTQKPPLYFWLAAMAGEPGGRVTEFAARLPSALSGVALVACVVLGGARALGLGVGLLAGSLLLTTWDVAHLARRAQLDVLMTLFTTMALFAFWQLQRLTSEQRRQPLLLLLYGSLGLAVLTKGPVGFLVPVLVMGVFLASEGRLGEWRRVFPAWGFALALGPTALWLAAAVALAPPGFFEAAVVDNLWGRFFRGTSHARPFYYYLYQFPIHGLPWTPLWLLVWVMRGRAVGDVDRARFWRFAGVWIATVLVFFSLSSGKRALYLLPAFPAVALLCADALRAGLRERADLPRWIAFGLGAAACGVAVAGIGVAVFAPARGAEIPIWVVVSTIGIPVAAVLAFRRLDRAARPAEARFGAVLGAVFALEWLLFVGYLPALNPEKSPKPIAEAAATHSQPHEPIALFKKRALVGGLNYYAGRRVVELDNPADTGAFLALGGRVIVVPAKYLEAVAEAAPLEILNRARSGAREILVVAPRVNSTRDPTRP